MRRARATAGALLTVLAVAVGTLGTVTAARAETVLGTLTFTPTTGSDLARPYLATHATSGPGGCPTEATNIVGSMTGPGEWSAGVTVIGNTSNGISTTGDFQVQLSDSFLNIANSNRLTLVAGRYEVTLRCQDALGTQPLGSFTGSIWFTTAHAWQDTAPGPGGPQTTEVAVSATPAGRAAPGDAVVLTATVTPATAQGTVQFIDTSSAGTSPLGSPIVVSNGAASLTTSFSTAGQHQISAAFASGDSAQWSSSSAPPLAYQVGGSAPVLGTLAFDPETGQDVTTTSFVTHSTGAPPGCPSDATNLTAWVTGPAGWSSPVLALSSTSNGLSSTSEMSLRFSDTWTGLAQANSISIVAGRYDVELRCQDALAQTIYGVFTGSLWFTDPRHYQVADPGTSATATTTTLSAAPTALAIAGDPVTLTAVVTPAGAVGSVTFDDLVNGTSVPLGAPVTVTEGHAQVVVTTMDRGLHSLTATFTPGSSARYLPSASAPVGYVIALPAPPRVMAPAALLGTPRVGESLTCQGSFTGPSELAFAWYRNGLQIAGAAATRALVGADLGSAVSCRALATGIGGTTVSTSPRVTVLLGAAPTLVKPPAVRGKLRVGTLLRATHGQWAPAGDRYSFRWRRDGKPIAGATSSTLRVRARYRGHVVSLAVTVRLTGHDVGRTVRRLGRVR